MSKNTIAPFNAARLVDARCQVEAYFYRVDTTSHESLLESVEAIRLSNEAPEAIKGMLAVVKTKAEDMFTDEEKASIFQDVPESDGTPYAFAIAEDGSNYPLIYKVLDQLTALVSKEFDDPVVSDERVTELEAKIAQLEEDLTGKDEQISEKESKIQELTGQIDDPQALEALQAEADALKAQLAQRDESITTLHDVVETLRTELAGLSTLKHDSLVKEAARLAGELGRAIAREKNFDELCEALAPRTDESLMDMIEDCKLELGTAVEGEEPHGTEPNATEPVIEKVADPTITIIKDTPDGSSVAEGESEQLPDPRKDPEGAIEQLKKTITTDPKESEVYFVGGHLTEEELAEIFGTTESEE